MNADRFKGHTRGTMFVKQNGNDSSGYYVQWHGMVVAQRMTQPNAELFKAAPELLAENERITRELSFFEAENARIKASNQRLEVEAIQRQSDHDRVRLAAKAENERLRAALCRIERWVGEFPPTGKFWDAEKTRPTSYSAEYGSNGERELLGKHSEARNHDPSR